MDHGENKSYLIPIRIFISPWKWIEYRRLNCLRYVISNLHGSQRSFWNKIKKRVSIHSHYSQRKLRWQSHQDSGKEGKTVEMLKTKNNGFRRGTCFSFLEKKRNKNGRRSTSLGEGESNNERRWDKRLASSYFFISKGRNHSSEALI